MTLVKFFYDGNILNGFSVKGHSTENCDDENGKLVCSAISSAVYLVANTVTEIIGDTADIKVEDALMVLRVDKPSDETKALLKGFKLHIEELSVQYSNLIKVYSEV